MAASRCTLCGYRGDDFAWNGDRRLVCPRCGEVAGEAGAEPIDVDSRTTAAGTAVAAVGGLTILAALVYLVVMVFFATPPPAPPAGQNAAERQGYLVGYYGALYALPAVGLALGAIQAAGGIQLARQRTWPLALIGAIAALMPCCGFVVGLPIGIWALVVLFNPAVRAAFR